MQMKARNIIEIWLRYIVLLSRIYQCFYSKIALVIYCSSFPVLGEMVARSLRNLCASLRRLPGNEINESARTVRTFQVMKCLLTWKVKLKLGK
jgi:hypothetical protein